MRLSLFIIHTHTQSHTLSLPYFSSHLTSLGFFFLLFLFLPSLPFSLSFLLFPLFHSLSLPCSPHSFPRISFVSSLSFSLSSLLHCTPSNGAEEENEDSSHSDLHNVWNPLRRTIYNLWNLFLFFISISFSARISTEPENSRSNDISAKSGMGPTGKFQWSL